MKKSFFRRGMAFFITLIYVSTNVLFVHSAEKNFWEERRTATHRVKGTVPAQHQQALVLAQLSGGAQFRVAPPKDLAPLPASPKEHWVGGKMPVFDGDLPRWLSDVVTPFATLKDVHLSRKRDAPVVIHVQDLHDSVEAQRNISDLIKALQDNRGVSLVGLEGAEGAFSLDGFRTFPDAGIARDVADHLMTEGYLGGPEFAGVTASRAPLLWGVENMKGYNANVEAVRASAKARPALRTFIKDAQRILDDVKTLRFSKNLQEFDRHLTRYHSDQESLGVYVKYLMTVSPSLRLKSPNLALFINALAWEESLDFKKIERERAELLERMVNTLSKEELNRLVAQSALYRLGRITYGEYYRFLRDQCTNVHLNDFKSLNDYIRYVLIAEKINRNDLLTELAHAERFAQDSLTKTEEDRLIVSASRRLAALDRLSRHAYTPDDWAWHLTHADEIHRTGDSVQDVARGAGLKETITNPAPDVLKPFEDFCAQALGRNGAMVKNLLDKMQVEHRTTAVLVAGGFHTEGLTTLLRQENISYAILTPKVSGPLPEGSRSLDLLARDPVPLEKLFAGETINVPTERVMTVHGSLDRLRPIAFCAVLLLSLFMHNTGKPANADVRRSVERLPGPVKVLVAEVEPDRCFTGLTVAGQSVYQNVSFSGNEGGAHPLIAGKRAVISPAKPPLRDRMKKVGFFLYATTKRGLRPLANAVGRRRNSSPQEDINARAKEILEIPFSQKKDRQPAEEIPLAMNHLLSRYTFEEFSMALTLLLEKLEDIENPPSKDLANKALFLFAPLAARIGMDKEASLISEQSLIVEYGKEKFDQIETLRNKRVENLCDALTLDYAGPTGESESDKMTRISGLISEKIKEWNSADWDELDPEDRPTVHVRIKDKNSLGIKALGLGVEPDRVFDVVTAKVVFPDDYTGNTQESLALNGLCLTSERLTAVLKKDVAVETDHRPNQEIYYDVGVSYEGYDSIDRNGKAKYNLGLEIQFTTDWLSVAKKYIGGRGPTDRPHALYKARRFRKLLRLRSFDESLFHPPKRLSEEWERGDFRPSVNWRVFKSGLDQWVYPMVSFNGKTYFVEVPARASVLDVVFHANVRGVFRGDRPIVSINREKVSLRSRAESAHYVMRSRSGGTPENIPITDAHLPRTRLMAIEGASPTIEGWGESLLKQLSQRGQFRLEGLVRDNGFKNVQELFESVQRGLIDEYSLFDALFEQQNAKLSPEIDLTDLSFLDITDPSLRDQLKKLSDFSLDTMPKDFSARVRAWGDERSFDGGSKETAFIALSLSLGYVSPSTLLKRLNPVSVEQTEENLGPNQKKYRVSVVGSNRIGFLYEAINALRQIHLYPNDIGIAQESRGGVQKAVITVELDSSGDIARLVKRWKRLLSSSSSTRNEYAETATISVRALAITSDEVVSVLKTLFQHQASVTKYERRDGAIVIHFKHSVEPVRVLKESLLDMGGFDFTSKSRNPHKKPKSDNGRSRISALAMVIIIPSVLFSLLGSPDLLAAPSGVSEVFVGSAGFIQTVAPVWAFVLLVGFIVWATVRFRGDWETLVHPGTFTTLGDWQAGRDTEEWRGEVYQQILRNPLLSFFSTGRKKSVAELLAHWFWRLRTFLGEKGVRYPQWGLAVLEEIGFRHARHGGWPIFWEGRVPMAVMAGVLQVALLYPPVAPYLEGALIVSLLGVVLFQKDYVNQLVDFSKKRSASLLLVVVLNLSVLLPFVFINGVLGYIGWAGLDGGWGVVFVVLGGWVSAVISRWFVLQSVRGRVLHGVRSAGNRITQGAVHVVVVNREGRVVVSYRLDEEGDAEAEINRKIEHEQDRGMAALKSAYRDAIAPNQTAKDFSRNDFNVEAFRVDYLWNYPVINDLLVGFGATLGDSSSITEVVLARASNMLVEIPNLEDLIERNAGVTERSPGGCSVSLVIKNKRKLVSLYPKGSFRSFVDDSRYAPALLMIRKKIKEFIRAHRLNAEPAVDRVIAETLSGPERGLRTDLSRLLQSKPAFRELLIRLRESALDKLEKEASSLVKKKGVVAELDALLMVGEQLLDRFRKIPPHAPNYFEPQTLEAFERWMAFLKDQEMNISNVNKVEYENLFRSVSADFNQCADAEFNKFNMSVLILMHIVDCPRMILFEQKTAKEAVLPTILETITNQRASADDSIKKIADDLEGLYSDLRKTFDRMAGEEEMEGSLVPRDEGLVIVPKNFGYNDLLQLIEIFPNLDTIVAVGGSSAEHWVQVARGKFLVVPGFSEFGSMAPWAIDQVTGVILDEQSSTLILNPTKRQRLWADTKKFFRNVLERRAIAWMAQKVKTSGPPASVAINAEDSDVIEQAFVRGVSGVGLARAEFLYEEILHKKEITVDTPLADKFFAVWQTLAEISARWKRPINGRLLDFQDDKLTLLNLSGDERGLDFLLHNTVGTWIAREDLKARFRAVLYRPEATLPVTFPEVATVADARECRALFSLALEEFLLGIQAKDREAFRKTLEKSVPLYFMIESPMTADQLSEILEEGTPAGISIGTNSLTDALFKIKKRGSDEAKVHYSRLEPKVLSSLLEILAGVKKYLKSSDSTDFTVKICGDLAGQPFFFPWGPAIERKTGVPLGVSVSPTAASRVAFLLENVDAQGSQVKRDQLLENISDEDPQLFLLLEQGSSQILRQSTIRIFFSFGWWKAFFQTIGATVHFQGSPKKDVRHNRALRLLSIFLLLSLSSSAFAGEAQGFSFDLNLMSEMVGPLSGLLPYFLGGVILLVLLAVALKTWGPGLKGRFDKKSAITQPSSDSSASTSWGGEGNSDLPKEALWGWGVPEASWRPETVRRNSSSEEKEDLWDILRPVLIRIILPSVFLVVYMDYFNIYAHSNRESFGRLLLQPPLYFVIGVFVVLSVAVVGWFVYKYIIPYVKTWNSQNNAVPAQNKDDVAQNKDDADQNKDGVPSSAFVALITSFVLIILAPVYFDYLSFVYHLADSGFSLVGFLLQVFLYVGIAVPHVLLIVPPLGAWAYDNYLKINIHEVTRAMTEDEFEKSKLSKMSKIVGVMKTAIGKITSVMKPAVTRISLSLKSSSLAFRMLLSAGSVLVLLAVLNLSGVLPLDPLFTVISHLFTTGSASSGSLSLNGAGAMTAMGMILSSNFGGDRNPEDGLIQSLRSPTPKAREVLETPAGASFRGTFAIDRRGVPDTAVNVVVGETSFLLCATTGDQSRDSHFTNHALAFKANQDLSGNTVSLLTHPDSSETTFRQAASFTQHDIVNKGNLSAVVVAGTQRESGLDLSVLTAGDLRVYVVFPNGQISLVSGNFRPQKDLGLTCYGRYKNRVLIWDDTFSPPDDGGNVFGLGGGERQKPYFPVITTVTNLPKGARVVVLSRDIHKGLPTLSEDNSIRSALRITDPIAAQRAIIAQRQATEGLGDSAVVIIDPPHKKVPSLSGAINTVPVDTSFSGILAQEQEISKQSRLIVSVENRALAEEGLVIPTKQDFFLERLVTIHAVKFVSKSSNLEAMVQKRWEDLRETGETETKQTFVDERVRHLLGGPTPSRRDPNQGRRLGPLEDNDIISRLLNEETAMEELYTQLRKRNSLPYFQDDLALTIVNRLKYFFDAIVPEAEDQKKIFRKQIYGLTGLLHALGGTVFVPERGDRIQSESPGSRAEALRNLDLHYIEAVMAKFSSASDPSAIAAELNGYAEGYNSQRLIHANLTPVSWASNRAMGLAGGKKRMEAIFIHITQNMMDSSYDKLSSEEKTQLENIKQVNRALRSDEDAVDREVSFVVEAPLLHRRGDVAREDVMPILHSLLLEHDRNTVPDPEGNPTDGFEKISHLGFISREEFSSVLSSSKEQSLIFFGLNQTDWNFANRLAFLTIIWALPGGLVRVETGALGQEVQKIYLFYKSA